MGGHSIRKWTVVLITAIIMSLTFLLIVGEKKTFSENENRYLARFPKLTWEQVKSGAYMEDLNAYLADHFAFRDFFAAMKTKTEKGLGKQKSNGIFFAGDGYLIEDYKEPENTQMIAETLQAFTAALSERRIKPALMLVPTAVYVHVDKLPPHAPVLHQMEAAEVIYEKSGMLPVDCSRRLLAHKEEALYYKTDHHWTTRGAYEGYAAYCEAAGLIPVPLEEMTKQAIVTDFFGTLYSRTGDYGRTGDTITLYSNQTDDLLVTYRDTGETADSLYNLEYANQKDKYSLFLNNLHPLVEITNENAASDRELVLIKDSYANSMVPYLAHHFKKIYVFDTRYYKEGPSNFIKENAEITDVLILYNMNTLDGDLGVRGIY